jgi:flagellar assembly factor FliW
VDRHSPYVRSIRSKEGEELVVAEAQLFRFPAGLPGFEDEREFALLEPAETAPVVTMQSTATPNLAFLAVPVACLDASYEPEILEEDLATLEGSSESSLDWLALIAADGENVTANLMAPIVLNRTRGVGVQAVRCDQRYPAAYRFGQIAYPAEAESQGQGTANGSPSCS